MTLSTNTEAVSVSDELGSRFDAILARIEEGDFYHDYDRATASLTTLREVSAALSCRTASTAGGVEVKALEWQDTDVGGIVSNARGYRIERGENDRFYARSSEASNLFATIEFASSLDEAKAVCQADFNQRILSSLHPADGEPGAHPDDIAVDRFAAAMKAKLAKKRGEGRGGWEDKEACSAVFLSSLLHGHVIKGDPVDVANLAMMLHERGDTILQTTNSAEHVPSGSSFAFSIRTRPSNPVSAEVTVDHEAFVVWLRQWVKDRFGVWITHNTAKGAHAALMSSINGGRDNG